MSTEDVSELVKWIAVLYIFYIKLGFCPFEEFSELDNNVLDFLV